MARNGKIFPISVGLTSQLVIGPNQNRKYLAFYNGSDNRVTLSMTTPVVFGTGLTVGENRSELILRIEDVGDCVTKAWYGISDAAAQLGIVEAEDDTPI